MKRSILLFLWAGLFLAFGQTKMNNLVSTVPAWDAFITNPQYQPLLAKQLSGAVVFSPFFDSQLTWFKAPAYVYLDAYAIYTDPTRNSALTNAHPEWILHDVNGNKLYIPWGCTAATATTPAACPQYAADVGNPKFVDAMAITVAQYVVLGYDLAFDDVNLTLDRVTDVTGKKIAPLDPRTGQAMTETAWENYFGSYLSTVRAVAKLLNPSFAVIHNAIWWYDAVPSPGVDQEIQAADFVQYERGFGDGGLTGGLGMWSLSNLMASIDRIHSLGSHLYFLEYSGATTFVYSMANYFAVTDGTDAIGFTDLTPDKWDANTLRLMNTDLGAPLGPRSRKYGLIERDFSKGYVLIAEPGAGPFTIIPDRPITDAYIGQPVNSITLPPKSGGVYLYQ